MVKLVLMFVLYNQDLYDFMHWSSVTLLINDPNRIGLNVGTDTFLSATKTRWSCHRSGTGFRVHCDIIKGGFIEQNGKAFD